MILFLKKYLKIKFANLKNYFPNDEWESITLNYTSGTTGDPKGVLYHHRGAHLMCLIIKWFGRWAITQYLWTLPMFHCNGWCFPWTIVALAGTQICTKKFDGKEIIKLIDKNNVTHLCGAPIILQMIIDNKKLKKTKKLLIL